MINVENLTVGYGKKRILENLNVTIPKGKITALIGPNGCGKSTLLKSISGSLTPSTGTVSLVDQDLSQLNHKKRAQRLSILAQSPITPEGITVQQLVNFGRNPYLSHWGKLSEQDHHKVQLALQETELQDFANTALSSLSGGQRQRAWIAMILAQDTEYVLLDEPTTYLDLTHQVDLMEMMRTMNRQGKTIVVVLHDLNQASRYCDHLIVMKKGKIIAQDSPQEIFNDALLKEVFNLDALIMNDPVANKPMCIAL
ncbi:Fe(3+) dicitrate ABC transporter ATP-binding protein FecE [Psychromonas sp. Urea-02u-13]|uniref:Fe(3+) dicitrate ABC transporter ATP-binding protein FecE n=1 Tax=Psychromonas sp. Urea-02u-13 TaxID=2058326 RepID=UPI000C32CC49|nr:Fe(3+) dicitrate ABC transporter ATP-binding protein FecE [Psychromonas sp. Urea-02u-13]PKG39081.1 ferric citrate ABC transporter ATP-binding protein FecE [Psychromonas sp. Urea-02u-13]